MINKQSLKKDVMAAIESINPLEHKSPRPILHMVSEKLKGDEEVVLAAVLKDSRNLRHASEDLGSNKEFVLKAIRQARDNQILIHIAPALQKDKEILLAAYKIEAFDIINYLNWLQLEPKELEVLFNDEEIVLSSVEVNGTSLEYASERLKDNDSIIAAAVNQAPRALKFASKEALLRGDYNLRYAPNELLNDKDFMLAQIAKNPENFNYVSKLLRKDKAFVLAAFSQSGHLINVPFVFRKDKDIVISVIKRDLAQFERVDQELKNDISFFWDVWNLQPYKRGWMDYSEMFNSYINDFLRNQILKFGGAVAGIIIGALMLSGVVTFPIPTIAALAIGACITAIGAIYASNQMYQHGVGFFNAKPAVDLELSAASKTSR